MFLPHIGVSLAVKPITHKASLGVLFIATMALDILYGIFSSVGIEHSGDRPELIYFPWSHGLFMSAVWAITATVVAFMFYRDRRTSIVIGLVVLSHWVLDFIMHDHELPLLFSDSPSVGIGLYYTFTATGTVVHWPQALISEFGLLGAGIAVYMYKTKAKDRMGVWLLWLVLFFLIVLAFVGFMLPQHLSFLSGIAITLLLFFGGNWVERHRVLSPLR